MTIEQSKQVEEGQLVMAVERNAFHKSGDQVMVTQISYISDTCLWCKFHVGSADAGVTFEGNLLDYDIIKKTRWQKLHATIRNFFS